MKTLCTCGQPTVDCTPSLEGQLNLGRTCCRALGAFAARIAEESLAAGRLVRGERGSRAAVGSYAQIPQKRKNVGALTCLWVREETQHSPGRVTNV